MFKKKFILKNQRYYELILSYVIKFKFFVIIIFFKKTNVQKRKKCLLDILILKSYNEFFQILSPPSTYKTYFREKTD